MPRVLTRDAKVSWQAVGSGEPVLLLNGLGSPSATWFRMVEALAPAYTVITLDNRGTGSTTAPSAPHDVPTMAADAAAVLAAAGGGPAHVVGHSMGGFLAQELALEHPDAVRSLVLAATHAGVPHLGADADPQAAAGLAAAASLSQVERASVLRRLLYAQQTSEHLILEDEAVRAAHPTSEDGFRNQLLGASTWERLSDLRTLAVPALVIHGDQDRIVPVRAGERLAATLPEARFELVTGAGHALFTVATSVVARAISTFLSDTSALAS
jgi:pimeloyl-ACP methyl ester carboxylesterase